MSKKKTRVAPTLTVREIGGVVRRTAHGGETPTCDKCGNNDHVVRMWHGKIKMWVCTKHYPITSSKTVPQTLKQRIMHKAPEVETYELTDILPNRRARRRRG